jgi:hypothetical protein
VNVKIKTHKALLTCEKRCSVKPSNPRSFTRHDYLDSRYVLPPPDDGEEIEHIFRCRVCGANKRWGLDSPQEAN